MASLLFQTHQTPGRRFRPKRFLLWNIADVQIGKDMLPLEEDTIGILKSLGMEYRGCLKMTMGSGGLNRVRNGKMVSKNFCKVKGKIAKYEPVFVFYKPGH